MKVRLDQEVMLRGLAPTRSQAESYIRLGQVKVNGQIVTKAGFLVGPQDKLELLTKDQYVSRAALKLASVADKFHLDFRGKTVLDVGSSTGGFTDYALQHGALKVIAVDVGTDQLHFSLRGDQRVELHEKTDIRDYATNPKFKIQNSKFDIILADVSFISLRQILPHVSKLMTHNSQLVAMVKPQFEAGASGFKHTSTSSGLSAKKALNKGVIKNDAMRRKILQDFETWAKQHFVIKTKADSEVSGAKGNLERFYLLQKLT